MATREVKRKHVAFKADKVSDDGTFSGYASVFGNADSYGEIVAPGAFDESIKRIKAGGSPLPVLWQHRSYEPIGGSDVLSEDDHGLKTEGFLLVKEVSRAAEAHALMKRRVIRGLSIGYYVDKFEVNKEDETLTLTKLDLIEYSVVTFPANELAQVEGVKASATVREFEDFLRDVGGFSRQQAKAIASGGFRAIGDARDAQDEKAANSAVLTALQNFKL